METKSILIVDDNEDARTILTHILRTAGYAPLAVADGEQGVAMLMQSRPALILLDLMMPRMSGFELLSRINGSDRTRGIPIIVISAYLGLGSDDILKLPGVTRIIPKGSFRIPALLAAVRELLDAPTPTPRIA